MSDLGTVDLLLIRTARDGGLVLRPHRGWPNDDAHPGHFGALDVNGQPSDYDAYAAVHNLICDGHLGFDGDPDAGPVTVKPTTDALRLIGDPQ